MLTKSETWYVFSISTANAIRSRCSISVEYCSSTNRRVVEPIIVAGNKRNESSTSTGATNASMYFHYSPVYSQFILYLYLINVSIVIIYAEINVTFTHSGTIVISLFYPVSYTCISQTCRCKTHIQSGQSLFQQTEDKRVSDCLKLFDGFLTNKIISKITNGLSVSQKI